MTYPNGVAPVLAGLVLLAAPLTAQAPAVALDDGIATLSWLAGCWHGDAGEECWLSPRGGVMIGINRGPEREGREPAFELLRIVGRDGGIELLASPGGRYPPVAFPALEVTTTRVVFANPEHDFPQRISYWLDGDEVLRARVEARVTQESGEWQGFDLAWKSGSWRAGGPRVEDPEAGACEP